MPEVVRIPVRLDCAGIDLTHPVDRMPPSTFPLLSNIRTVEEGRIESRPGYGLYDASASAPKLLHSIRRLNDPDESFAPAGYVNVVGNGTIIEAGVENTLTQIDSGYSGNPLSLIAFRPEQSPESWMYAYDQNKQIKVRPDGVTRPIGVAPPNKGPSIDYGPPANVDIAAAQNDTGWSYSGAFGTQDRTAGSSPVIDAILYNFGSTGWCCIAVTITNGYNFQWAASRMKILLGGAAGGVGTVNTSGTGVTFETGVPFNTGWTGSIVINGVSYPISSVGSTTSITLSGGGAGTQTGVSYQFGTGEEVFVREVNPAVAATTIQGIQYDSGTSGTCSIVLTGSPSGLVRNSLLSITNGASQTDIVRVLEVNLSPDGTIYSIRCSTTHTFAATDAVAGVMSFYSYTALNHVAAETIASSALSMAPVATTNGSGVVNTNGTAVGLVSGTLFNVGWTGSIIINGVTYTIASVSSTTQLTLTSSAGIQGGVSYSYGTSGAILSYAGAINASLANGRPIDPANDWLSFGLSLVNPQYVVNIQLLVTLDATPNFSFSNPGNTWIWTITAAQLAALGATSGGTGAAQNWYEIQVPISSGVQTGGNPLLTFASISGVAIQLTVAGGVSGWAFDWWYFFGTYGPVIQPNSPVGYLYESVDRDSTTGAESVPGPQTRYELFPLRESVLVTPQASTESGVDSLDIYRQGGTLTGFVYVATVGNGTVNTVGTAVTWESGALFSIGLTGTITINGVMYPISVVNSTTSITLGVSAGTQTGASYATTYIDGIPDTSLLASPAPDLTKIQPWPLLALPWSGVVNVVGTTVEWVSGAQFNTALLSATIISINGVAYQTYGQPRTATFLELFLDAGVQGNVPYLIASPTLAGQPLPYAFGPLEGPLAPVVWALGDPVSGGNLYWTNFSDGDSADDANFLELTPPSEPLVSGQVWNGIVIVGSRDNVFLVRYSFVTNSVYQFNRIPSPSGMWTRWSTARGPDGVYFLGRDGIYLATEAGAKSITDAQLYPLFPHDGAPAVGSPFLNPVDMTQAGKNMRLSAGDFDVYFDYLDTSGNYCTLRFDIPKQRWFPHVYGDNVLLHYLVDESVSTPSTPQILMLGATSGNIYSSGGNDDAGVAVTCQALLPYQDGGDFRTQKLVTDYVTDADGVGTVNAIQYYNNGVSNGPTLQFIVNGPRTQNILNISHVPNILNLYRNISVLFSWTGGPAGPRLYDTQLAWYNQPFLSTRVITQFIALDSPGTWLHMRRLYAGVLSTSPVTFTVTTQDGRVYSVVIPSTNGQFSIAPIMMPQGCKFLSAAFMLDSAGVPFALFPESFTPETKFWQEPSYINLAVFLA